MSNMVEGDAYGGIVFLSFFLGNIDRKQNPKHDFLKKCLSNKKITGGPRELRWVVRSSYFDARGSKFESREHLSYAVRIDK